MRVVQQWLPDLDFRSPDPRTIKGQTVTVPNVYGYDPQRAARILRDAGLFPTIGSLVDSSNSYGTVAYLSPGSGTEVGSGSSVTIYISDGSPYVAPAPAPKTQPSTEPTPDGGGGDGPGNGGGDGPGNGGGRKPR